LTFSGGRPITARSPFSLNEIRIDHHQPDQFVIRELFRVQLQLLVYLLPGPENLAWTDAEFLHQPSQCRYREGSSKIIDGDEGSLGRAQDREGLAAFRARRLLVDG